MNYKRFLSIGLALIMVLQLLTPISTVSAITETQVILVGSLQDELGGASEWDPGDSATEMTMIPNTSFYYFIGQLPAGSYEYKVAYNGSWDENYGAFNYGQASFFNSGNYSLELLEKTEVMFLYDSDSKRLTTVSDQTESLEADIQLAGSMNGWDAELETGKLISMTNGYYVKELTLDPGDYEYKYVFNRNWDTALGTDTGGNKTITVTETGKVLFLFDSYSMTETVLFEEVPVRKATLVGSLQDELGASGDWDPSLSESDLTYYGNNIYYKEGNLVAGDYEYKVAIDHGWDEAYYTNNIPLSLASDQTVAFLFNDGTKRITDSLGHTLTLTGSLQMALGAGSDWAPDDFTTSTISKEGLEIVFGSLGHGNYEYKYSYNGSWDQSYGIDGVMDGGNISYSPSGETSYFVAREQLFNEGSEPFIYTAFSQAEAEEEEEEDTNEASASPVKNPDGTVTFYVNKSNPSYNSDLGDLYIIGDFVGWDEGQQIVFENDPEEAFLSVTLDFVNDFDVNNQVVSYKFKYATWDGNEFLDTLNPEESGGNSLVEIGIAPENLSYHVTGSFQGWGPGDDEYIMEDGDGDGIYTLTIPLAAARHEYKVTRKYKGAITWVPDGQGNNHIADVVSASDVTFYFNSNLYNAGTNMDPVASSLDMKILDLYVKDLSDDATYGPMVDDGFNGTYTHEFIGLEAGTYEFAIVDDEGNTFADDSTPYQVTLNEAFDLELSYLSGNDAILDNYAPNLDGLIDDHTLIHNSWDEEYRSPFGAVPSNTRVNLSIETALGDASKVMLVIDGKPYKLTAEASGSKDIYSKAITLSSVGVHSYYFIVQDGSTRIYYNGVTGEGSTSESLGSPYTITVYPEDYATPDWMKLSITYQIFGDRFYNGDTSNDQEKIFGMGDIPLQFGDWDDYNSFENTRYSKVDPENYNSLMDENGWDLDWHNDVYGGDLAGVSQKLDYLQDLGVKTIYFNPIFESISAHKYDSADYSKVDPRFGTNEDFELLAREAKDRGMNIILDGVFNHVGSDSLYFNKYGKNYTDGVLGAYEAWMLQGVVDGNADAIALYDELIKDNEGGNFRTYDFYAPYLDGSVVISSPYASWFNIEDDGAYEGWWGYDSLPVIQSIDGSELNVESFTDYVIEDDDSIARQWIESGSSGWRLDVSPEVSMDFWLQLREYIKGDEQGDLVWPNGEPIILAENWGDATGDFLSGAFDSTMNYRFREAAIEFVIDETTYSKYNDTGAEPEETWTPSDAKTLNEDLMTYFEKYPKESSYVLMNLLGSHDVPRILGVLGYLEVDRPLYPGTISAISQEFGVDASGHNIVYLEDFVTFGLIEQEALTTYIDESNRIARERFELASLLQMTYPGSPTVYYGDEIGMSGYHDPDNRRQFNWSLATPDNDVANYISELAEIRNDNLVLQTGEFIPLSAEEGQEVYAFGRLIEGSSDALGNTSYITNFGTGETIEVRKNNGKAVVIMNKNARESRTITLSLEDLTVEPGEQYVDALTGDRYKVKDGMITITVEQLSGVILFSSKVNSGNNQSSSKKTKVVEIEEEELAQVLIEFKDVNGWYSEYVYDLAGRSLMLGKGGGIFDPLASITRAEVIQVLSNMSTLKTDTITTESFSDVSPDKWYSEAVMWAKEIGLALGYKNEFFPEKTITRQDLAVLLDRYLEIVALKSLEADQLDEVSDLGFKDGSKISGYALNSVNKMKANNIISGTPDGEFLPKSNAKRSEAAKLFYYILKEIEKSED